MCLFLLSLLILFVWFLVTFSFFLVAVFINVICKAYPTNEKLWIDGYYDDIPWKWKAKKDNVSGASGDNGTGPTASSDECAENVKVQTAVSQQQLASVQQGPGKGHWSWRQLVVRPDCFNCLHETHFHWKKLFDKQIIFFSDLTVNIKSVSSLSSMLNLILNLLERSEFSESGFNLQCLYKKCLLNLAP